jgi:hypothetical protein
MLVFLADNRIGALYNFELSLETRAAVVAPNQGTNQHLSVNRVPLVKSTNITVGESFVIVMILENRASEPIFDLNFTQNYQKTENKNYLKVINSTSQNFTDQEVKYVRSLLLPGERFLFNTTLLAVGNEPSSSVSLPTITVIYKFSELLIPESSESDIDSEGIPRAITFTIINPEALKPSYDYSEQGLITLATIAPVIFIIFPTLTWIAISFFWTKKNRRAFQRKQLES